MDQGVVRAINVKEFCRRYNVGMTLAYEQINCGKLKTVKCGRRRLIKIEAAEEWFRNLEAETEAAA